MTCDLLIVGAGPAGMAAAIAARRAGLSVVVADENPAAGGQVYRAVMDGPLAKEDRLGADYRAGRPLAEAFAACGAQHLCRTTVFMIERQDAGGFTVSLAMPDRACLIEAGHVMIASGALERPFPIPGWTLPGVMTAGAAQTLLKTSAIVPEGPTVLAGCGPLLYLLAAQYAQAGIKLAAILDTTPRGNWLGALPHLPGFLASPYLFKGLKLLHEALSAHRLIRNVSALEAKGENQLSSVEAVAGGRRITIPAATLLLHQGVVPQINLAMASGVSHLWNKVRLAFEPSLSAAGETDIRGLFITGDSAGIAGAEAAAARGILGALAIADRIDPAGTAARQGQRRDAVARLNRAQRGRAFLDALCRPASQFRIPADDVIVCRCEDVAAGDLRRLIRQGAQGPNQLKVFSRAGMGPCQGRSCGLTLTELFAEQSGHSAQAIGHLRLRAPVKPVTVGQMAGLEPYRSEDAG
ncbi:MAG TPA: NAD(P)/FAD-dependent oxidoreductase [Beijerinckiaceae bacterium]|nr:NAD(P)/FAD-dependent oxidoreductase [Beijerinckiaceae bacterium]